MFVSSCHPSTLALFSMSYVWHQTALLLSLGNLVCLLIIVKQNDAYHRDKSLSHQSHESAAQNSVTSWHVGLEQSWYQDNTLLPLGICCYKTRLVAETTSSSLCQSLSLWNVPFKHLVAKMSFQGPTQYLTCIPGILFACDWSSVPTHIFTAPSLTPSPNQPVKQQKEEEPLAIRLQVH